MHPQARYDALLVALPVLLVLGGVATLVTSGVLAAFTALGTGLAAVSTVGHALFVENPTDR